MCKNKKQIRVLMGIFVIGLWLGSAFWGRALEAARAGSDKLNASMPVFGDVDDFLISPDGQYVVYRADQETDASKGLYSVPITGGTPVRLSGLLPTGYSVESDYRISPDNQYVVFRSPQSNAEVSELYSIPITGPASAAVKLNVPLLPNGDIASGFLLSPDSSRVVYRVDQQGVDIAELFSVPIGGPASANVKLNKTLPAGGDVSSDVQISPDSSRVVYRADQNTDEVRELFSVPIVGPADSGIRLNGIIAFGGNVSTGFKISPDSSRVVYRADQQFDEIVELYSVAIANPNDVVKMNSVLVAGGDISESFRISADNQYVIYLADQQTNDIVELYSVPLTGPSSAGIKLNPILAPGGNVSSFEISPDGGRVVFRAAVLSLSLDLYSVPVAGPSSASTRLNKNLFTGSVASDFQISADSAYVVYRANQESTTAAELYAVPLNGPNSAGVKLNAPLVAGGSVSSAFIITADSGRVVFRADVYEDNLVELFSVPIVGPGQASIKLNAPLVAGGDVLSGVLVDANNSRAVYRSDRDMDDVIELFASDLDAMVSFYASTSYTPELAGTVSIRLYLKNPAAHQSYSIDYQLTGGTATVGDDFLFENGTVVFAPGEYEKTITVTILDDAQSEPSETVMFTLTNLPEGVIGDQITHKLWISETAAATYLPATLR